MFIYFILSQEHYFIYLCAVHSTTQCTRLTQWVWEGLLYSDLTLVSRGRFQEGESMTHTYIWWDFSNFFMLPVYNPIPGAPPMNAPPGSAPFQGQFNSLLGPPPPTMTGPTGIAGAPPPMYQQQLTLSAPRQEYELYLWHGYTKIHKRLQFYNKSDPIKHKFITRAEHTRSLGSSHP